MNIGEFLEHHGRYEFTEGSPNVQRSAGWLSWKGAVMELPGKLNRFASLLSHTSDTRIRAGYEAAFRDCLWNDTTPYGMLSLTPAIPGKPAFTILVESPAFPYTYLLTKEQDPHYVYVSDDPGKIMKKVSQCLDL